MIPSLLMATAMAGQPTVVLVSLDTTRVDAVSCYGRGVGPQRSSTATTPNLDALAEAGIRFERFYANAPSTLSSHTTLFTGLDPHGHGVVRNGYPVDPTLPTLAQRLRGEGYDTIAILGAAALERAMGLDRGFRVYDDEAPQLHGMMYQDTAENVVARSLAAVDARSDPQDPLFLFVHFYDPHTPYAPPAAFADRFTDPDYDGSLVGSGDRFKKLVQQVRAGKTPVADIEHANALYLAEVAYMDHQLGVLLEGLEARGLLDTSLVIAVADHGETLFDPIYAWSHGSNVADEVIRVPLIVQGRGLPLATHAVVQSQASMDGLAKTIERAVGVAPTLGTGLDFFHLWQAGPLRDRDGWPEHPTLPVFAEATRPRGAEVEGRWNNLRMHRAVWAGGWGVYGAPFIPVPYRFYDVGELPHPDILDALVDQIGAWDSVVPAHVDPQMAPSTKRALKALGYLD